MLTQATLEKLLAFRKEREWEQFHSPKNVSMALSVEAAELMEIFQWASDADTTDLAIRRRKDIEYEVAEKPKSDLYRDVLPGFTPIAFGNPIYVDADGDGRFRAPGLPERSALPATIAQPDASH